MKYISLVYRYYYLMCSLCTALHFWAVNQFIINFVADLFLDRSKFLPLMTAMTSENYSSKIYKFYEKILLQAFRNCSYVIRSTFSNRNFIYLLCYFYWLCLLFRPNRALNLQQHKRQAFAALTIRVNFVFNRIYFAKNGNRIFIREIK